MTDRINRDEMYMRMAELFALRSTCTRGHVGVVLVKDRRPIGGGYNGAPSGMATCYEVGCHMYEMDEADAEMWPLEMQGCQRAVHAELNALIWAARQGVKVQGATMYGVYSPCRVCAFAIVASHIERFVYRKPYRAERLDLLTDADIEVVHLEEST